MSNPNVQDKQKYWEWRQHNNPFENPYKKGYKPGFFENAPGRRILFLWLPMMIGTIASMNLYAKRESRMGRGVISVPLEVLSDYITDDPSNS